MRADNLIIVGLAILALGSSVWAIVRWGRLPIQASVAPISAGDGRWPSRLVASLRALGPVCSAGIVCGLLIAGVLGRFVMRALAATSGDDAQGRLTDADEVVGEITLGGTMGFIFFVGLGSGAVVAIALLVARPWLHVNGAVAGLMAGLVPLGLVGNKDFSSDNVDFSILSPAWLAVGLIVGGAALFGAACGSVAARLQQIADGHSRFRNMTILGVIPFALVPPLVVGLAVYVIGRSALPGRLAVVLDRRPMQWAGRIVVAGLLGSMVLQTLQSSVGILRI